MPGLPGLAVVQSSAVGRPAVLAELDSRRWWAGWSCERGTKQNTINQGSFRWADLLTNFKTLHCWSFHSFCFILNPAGPRFKYKTKLLEVH